MRLRTFMRQRRQARGFGLREVSRALICAPGDLSRFERGHAVPGDDQVADLEAFYGPRDTWYPPTVLKALVADRICPGCGEPLPPEVSARVIYHDRACQQKARKEKRA